MERGRLVHAIPSDSKLLGTSNPVLDRMSGSVPYGQISPYWKSLLREEFSNPVVASGPSEQVKAVSRKKRIAHDAVELLTAIGEHEKLLDQYGWGQDRPQKKLMAQIAQKCGLELPDSDVLSHSAMSLSDQDLEELEKPAFGQEEIDRADDICRRLGMIPDKN
jgi:hypothetical protein